MHFLSPTLLAAQRAASSVPAVQAVLSDRMNGVTRLAWTRLYAGSEPDYYHTGAVSGSGAFLRARTNPADYGLYYQRVPSPEPGSSFGTWQSLGPVSAFSGLALAARSSTVLLFHVGGNQRDVMVRESADDGVSFGPAQMIFDPGSITDWLAADFSTSGTPALFFSAGNLLYWTKRTAGAWTAPQAWPYGLTGFAGLACRYLEGDWCLIVCAQAGGEPKAWSCIFGDGGAQPSGTWSSLREMIAASAGSGVTYRTPSLAKPDLPRALLVEKYVGAGAYTRVLATHARPNATFSGGVWREPVPFDLSVEHGPTLTASASHAWMTTPAGVWRAPLAAAGVDLSADVLEAEAVDEPGGQRARLVLDNGRQAYAAGNDAALRLGAELTLSWGYRTAAGQEYAPAQRYWVRAFERQARDGRAVAVVEAEGLTGLLAAARVRRQRTWAAGTSTVQQTLIDLLTMLGLEAALAGGSNALQTLTPAFTISPNESLGEAVLRLLSLVPDVLRTSGGTAEIVHPQATDGSVYAYGADHRVLEAADLSTLAPVNRVQVYGAGVLGEAFLWPDVEAVGDRLRQVIDAGLTTSSQVSDRAATELRRAAALPRQAGITVSFNCGQQLYDVVAVTVPALEWAGRQFRVVGLSARYARGRGRVEYRQRLDLGGV